MHYNSNQNWICFLFESGYINTKLLSVFNMGYYYFTFDLYGAVDLLKWASFSSMMMWKIKIKYVEIQDLTWGYLGTFHI